MTTSEETRGPGAAWVEMPDGSETALSGDCRIGRIQGNEIINPDDRTSRRHAVLQPQSSRWILVDLASTNGTFVNDSRIFKPALLEDGDVITVGGRRYTFRQPRNVAEAAFAAGDTMDDRTMAAVGRTYCWMMLVTPANSPDEAWSERVARALDAQDAGRKQLPNGALLAHWREDRVDSAQIRELVLELGGQSSPPGAALIVHYGGVRVGPSAVSGEENLLGPDVTFTHQVGSAIADLGARCIVSEPAVESLGLGSDVSPLETEGLPDSLGAHPLFKIA